jgi:hypothetical protein
MTKNDISRPLYGENTQYLWREKGSNVPKHVQSISTIGTLGILQMYSAFFQSLKGKDDVSAEILARNLHVDYIGECTAYCTLCTWT